jgi:hypothetical protein
MDSFLALGFMERFQRRIQLLAVIIDRHGSIGALLLLLGVVLLSFRLAPVTQRYDHYAQQHNQSGTH